MHLYDFNVRNAVHIAFAIITIFVLDRLLIWLMKLRECSVFAIDIIVAITFVRFIIIITFAWIFLWMLQVDFMKIIWECAFV